MNLKTNFKNDISDIHDNLVLKDNGDIYAMFEVPKAIINSIDRNEKDDFKALTTSVLSGIREYKNFDISMIPLDVELDTMYLKLSQDFSEDTEDLAWYILDESYTRLHESVDRIFEYHWYLTIPLKSSHISFDKKEMRIVQEFNGVENFTLSRDFKKVVFYTLNNDLYLYDIAQGE